MKKTRMFFIVLTCALALTTGCYQVNPNQTTVPIIEADTTLATVPLPTEYRFPEGAVIELYSTVQAKDMQLNAFLQQVTGLTVFADYPNQGGIMGRAPSHSLAFATNVDSINLAGSYGSVVNLMDYREEMPNFFTLFESEQYADYQDAYIADDGALYVSPVFVNGSTEHSAWLYREDVFQKLELQVPTDWDSFYGILKVLKAAYPESYPFAMGGLSSLADFAQQLGVDYDPKGFAQGQDRGFYDSTVTEEMREMLKKLRQLAEEGLIDPKWPSDDTEMCIQALAEGSSFITHTKASFLQTIEAAGQAENAEFSLSWFNNIPLTESGIPYVTRTESVKKYGWYIHADFCPDIDLAVRYLDWMYSDEGVLTTSWGVENISYGVDENGNKYYLDIFAVDAENKALLANPSLSGYIDFEATLQNYTLKNRELIRATVETAKSGGLHPVSNVIFSGEDALFIDTYLQSYLNIRTEYIIKFLAGDLDINSDAHWQQMVAAIEASKQAELLEVFNATLSYKYAN